MKKFTLFTTLTLCILLLVGCAGGSNNDSNVENSHSDKEIIMETVSQKFSNVAGTSIDVLREEMEYSRQAQFGVAYIGYFDSSAVNDTDIDFRQWFYSASSPLAAAYPFVSEIDENHTIGTEGHLYCIIAKDYESTISVSRIGDDYPIYTAKNGDPILLFCNADGNAEKADTVVTIKTADGMEYQYKPTLDEIGYPDILVGDERALLSWDFTPIDAPETGFDLEEWINEGWGGPTAIGLAYDESGTEWWISTWDNSVSYRVNFYLNEDDGYDGDVSIECFYDGYFDVQAMWLGKWRIEILGLDMPTCLYLDVTLISGDDMEAFAGTATVSESYAALVHQSGNYLLLVAGNGGATLPIFPEGVQAVELTYADVLAEG